MSSRDYFHPFTYQFYAFFVEYVFFATAIYCILTAIGDFIFEKSIFGSIKKIEIQNWSIKYVALKFSTCHWQTKNFFILYIYLATIIKINFFKKNPKLGYSQILNL